MSLVAASLALLCLCLSSVPAQGPLFLRHGDLVRRDLPGQGLEAVLAALLAGPSAAEQARGYTSAIPMGTRLVGLRTEPPSGVVVVLSAELRQLLSGAGLEAALEQIDKTALDSGPYHRVRIEVEDGAGGVARLEDLLRQHEPPVGLAGRRAPPVLSIEPGGLPGALAGRTIAVSAGHGYYWHETLGWTTQRPLIDGLVEDVHTAEIAMHWLIPYLENMGARVLSCRDRGEIAHELLADNDRGAPAYRETGAWTTSASSGWGGGSYRHAATATASSATAAWTLPVAKSGSYPVHVLYRAGTNRAADALYVVHHAGGATEVRVDQTRDDLRWVHLGDFWFEALGEARVVLDNRSAQPGRVVIADAVRLGGGLGSIVRGGRASGQPRWKECSRYAAQLDGAPASVWDSSTDDHSDDVTCRPRWAEWRGADAYVSLHTNAGGGSGTDTYIYSGGASAGSPQLQAAVQRQIVTDIRAAYDPFWVDRGSKQANFGEVRLLQTMPGILVELAFHDVADSKDHRALHDPEFRRIAGRAYARGVLRYFSASAPFPPEPPEAVRAVQDGAFGLRVAWEAVPGATLYSIEQSPDGKGFVEAGQTALTSWAAGPLPHGTQLAFRVRALNASGRSLPSDVVAARTAHDGRAEVLLVGGFDRHDRYVRAQDNTHDWLGHYGEALRRSAEFSLGFDSASNEAVERGRVALAPYRAVVWSLGEESTAHETFSAAEQAQVRAYLAAGGRLLVSGAEIAWDLDWRGSAADRAFCHDVLGVRYVADDAATYAFLSPTAGVLQGVPAGRFDDGSGGTYDVDYPDVLAPSDAKSAPCLWYGNQQPAAVARIDGQSRVLCFGLPLETIVDRDARAAIIAKALRFVLAPRALEAEPSVAPGNRLPLALDVPADRGSLYVLAASAGTSPGIPLPPKGVLPLVPDALFALSLGQSNGVFQAFAGLLDAQGRAAAEVRVPADARLRGLRFYVSGLTLVTPIVAPRTLLPWYSILVR